MSEELYNKLRDEFYRSNHVKYRKYFEEWLSNVTMQQLQWWATHWNLPLFDFNDKFNEEVTGVAVGKL